MNLFHESENKYYELLSYMINSNDDYSSKDISDFIDKYLIGEKDFDVIDELFESNEDGETVFSYSEGKYYPVINKHFPIRLNEIEAVSLKSMTYDRYARHFLSKSTINKLQQITSSIPQLWNANDIQIKNQYHFGDAEIDTAYDERITTIVKAINEHKGIVYDNISPGKYEYIDVTSFPINIEYSFLNDGFRVCVYNREENRFIKLNLSTIKNIKLSHETIEDLSKEYQDFLEMNTKKIELDVEPVDHVIERCFRIFSFYDREAKYDKEDNKYKLTISYLKQEENEVIRDILSLGSYVVVMSPKRIQKEVYKRIVAAKNNYL